MSWGFNLTSLIMYLMVSCAVQQLPGDSPENRELEALTEVGNWESTHASKKLGILGHFVQSCFCLNTKTPKSVSSEREEINAICLTDLAFQLSTRVSAERRCEPGSHRTSLVT